MSVLVEDENPFGPAARWMVRREVVAQPMFGDRPLVAWSVTMYMGRRQDGGLVVVDRPRPFRSRTQALEFAHREADRFYRARGAYGGAA